MEGGRGRRENCSSEPAHSAADEASKSWNEVCVCVCVSLHVSLSLSMCLSLRLCLCVCVSLHVCFRLHQTLKVLPGLKQL